MEESAKNEEPKFRICVTQNTKGYQWEVTVRENTAEAIKEALNEAVRIAKKKCEELSNGLAVGI